MTRASISRQGLSARRMTRPERPRARQRSVCTCQTLSPVSLLGLGLRLGGLGHDRGFLYRKRVLLVLCRDRMWSRPGSLVSRHINCVATGWRDRCVTEATCTISVRGADEFCRDRLIKFFYLNRQLSVTKEIVRSRVVTEILCRNRAWGWGS